jgi:hypothetical protein
MSQHASDRRKPRVAPNAYAGSTTCLRCDDTFESWDRRQNRLCSRCRAAIAAEPTAETLYRLPKRWVRDGDEA